jgi:hypothetical protein
MNVFHLTGKNERNAAYRLSGKESEKVLRRVAAIGTRAQRRAAERALKRKASAPARGMP